MDEHLLTKIREAVGAESIEKIGRGVYGEAYLLKTPHGDRVLKTMALGGFGHDHYADIAHICIWQNDTFARFPRHVVAHDVLAIDETSKDVHRIGKCTRFYLLMDYAKGTSYFTDLDRMLREGITETDKKRCTLLAKFLASVHAHKHHNPSLYRRKFRDTIGHGECIMGILDHYPSLSFFPPSFQKRYVSACLDAWIDARTREGRLSMIHGDFHPGNILFDGDEFTLIDRSRGEWGEPADDLTALSINYIFYAFLKEGTPKGYFIDLLRLLWDTYLSFTHDRDIYSAAPLFFAFRALVVAHPLFYSDSWYQERTDYRPSLLRKKILRWAYALLKKGRFEI